MNTVIASNLYPGGQKLEIVHGDITQEPIDAIVNAANSRLLHGGGVAGIISHRGGPQIQIESDAWVRQHGPVTHAKPAYTSAGNLPCRYIIHAVGPVWGEGDEDAKLKAAIQGSLELADQLKLSSLALPAISTGIFGFPKELAARITFKAIESYFSHQPTGSTLRLVRMILFDPEAVSAFTAEFGKKDKP
jgi:O-acetyl-ADP-ribose deacetylase (regulator of RNase III)